MKHIRSLSLTIVGVFLILCSNATAQSFSCSFGRPACLGYDDKVVSSSATCLIHTHAWEASFANLTFKALLVSTKIWLMSTTIWSDGRMRRTTPFKS